MCKLLCSEPIAASATTTVEYVVSAMFMKMLSYVFKQKGLWEGLCDFLIFHP
jgi:hypothetical protein